MTSVGGGLALTAWGHTPWWAYLIVTAACTAVYICRVVLAYRLKKIQYRLADEALDNAAPAQIPDIIGPVMGHLAVRTTRVGRISAPAEHVAMAA
jgi:hypothetical protein